MQIRPFITADATALLRFMRHWGWEQAINSNAQRLISVLFVIGIGMLPGCNKTAPNRRDTANTSTETTDAPIDSTDTGNIDDSASGDVEPTDDATNSTSETDSVNIDEIGDSAFLSANPNRAIGEPRCEYLCLAHCQSWGGSPMPGACDLNNRCCEGAVAPAPDSQKNRKEDAANRVETTVKNSAPEDIDPAQAIAQADIVHIANDTLYTLSRFDGLNAIDISDRLAINRIGRFIANGIPVAMHIRDDVAIILYTAVYDNGFGEQNEIVTSKRTSRVVTVDISDPVNMTELGSTDIPGDIRELLVSGDVLYVVSYQNGHCDRCSEEPNISVTSMTLTNNSNINAVDTLHLPTAPSSEHICIAMGSERMYVAGQSQRTPSESVLYAVDISNPAGAMTKGLSAYTAGRVESGWQMDEYDGVLRVISQAGYNPDIPDYMNLAEAVVETFTVRSTPDLRLRGELEMQISTGVALKSVRFDGTRAYVATDAPSESFLVFDLTDPDNPQQIGQLNTPQGVYHLAPRGDRLFAFGHSIPGDVSDVAMFLIDVSDPANPVMLHDVNVGSNWETAPDNQNQIHKGLTFLEDEGIILLPFSDWRTDSGGQENTFHSGIQLLNFTNDFLSLSGVAPVNGVASRARIHDGTLLAISDIGVEAFDISNPDTPKLLSEFHTSHTVVSAVNSGSYLVETVADWRQKKLRLEVHTMQESQASSPIGVLELTGLIDETNGFDSLCQPKIGCPNVSVFAHGDHAYLLWYPQTIPENETGDSRGVGIATIQLTDPTEPQLLDTAVLPATFTENGSGNQSPPYAPLVGDALVQQGPVITLRNDSMDMIYVLDFTTPDNIAYTNIVDVSNSDGSARAGILSSDDGIVVTSHFDLVPGDDTMVKFYLDRLDISDPKNPVWAPPVNVPGTPIYYSEATGELVTLDYQHVETATMDTATCQGITWNPPQFTYDDVTQTCTRIQYRLIYLRLEDNRAVVQSEHVLDDSVHPKRIIATDTAVFLSTVFADYAMAQRLATPELIAWSHNESPPFNHTAKWTFPSIDAVLTNAQRHIAAVTSAESESAYLFRSNDEFSTADMTELHLLSGGELRIANDFAIVTNNGFGVNTLNL